MANKKRERLQAAAINQLAAKLLSGGPDRAEDAITATGSTIADAYALTKPISRIGTTAANTGVILTDALSDEPFVIIQNGGASTLDIYPETATGTIDGGSAGAPITLATTKSVFLTKVTATDWMSIAID